TSRSRLLSPLLSAPFPYTTLFRSPLWEFGSFGCTGCHNRNLMNPNRLTELSGARLAFAQNGDLGIKLVHLTPPVSVVHHGFKGRSEEHTSELQSLRHLVCRLLLEK